MEGQGCHAVDEVIHQRTYSTTRCMHLFRALSLLLKRRHLHAGSAGDKGKYYHALPTAHIHDRGVRVVAGQHGCEGGLQRRFLARKTAARMSENVLGDDIVNVRVVRALVSPSRRGAARIEGPCN